MDRWHITTFSLALCDWAMSSYFTFPEKVATRWMPQSSRMRSISKASPPMLYSPRRLMEKGWSTGVSFSPTTFLKRPLLAMWWPADWETPL